jgi:predicted short-subunit dehydrogenase-like oxidoreductase (DUF2520 family)
MRTFTIIGVGKVGGAMALALPGAGFSVEVLVSRHPSETSDFAASVEGKPRVLSVSEFQEVETDFVLITTQDSEIKGAAELLSDLKFKKPQVTVFHASGALSSGELSVLKGSGRNYGSIHPLVSISDPQRGAEVLQGAFFAVEGDDVAVEFGCEIAKKLRGNPFEIATNSKTLYHAAAVVACGHLSALIHTSQKMLLRCGIDDETATQVLIPLIKSTVSNLSEMTPAEALTGPFQRADIGTIKKHLEKIGETADKDMEAVYRSLGVVSLELAELEGADRASLDEIRKIILLDNNISK